MAAASLLLCSFLKCFFGLVAVIFLQYIANVTRRTFEIVPKKSRFRKYKNYLIISVIKNVERASTARARESRDFHVRGTVSGPNDVRLTLPADSVYKNGVVEVSLLYV